MTYKELGELFRQHERTNPAHHLTGHIIFSSFGPDARKGYSERERTYAVSSNNKAFLPNMGGYSVYGSCLDGLTDPCLRLDQYMAEEHGGKDGWIVEDCCLLGYLLTCVNERIIQPPRFFTVHADAFDAMLQELCKEGNLEYQQVKEAFDRYHSGVTDSYFELTKNAAWLNAGRTGGWDWSIHAVRIFNVNHITFEWPQKAARRR